MIQNNGYTSGEFMNVKEIKKKILENYNSVSEFVKVNSLDDILIYLCEIFGTEREVLKKILTGEKLRNGQEATYYDSLIDIKENINYYDIVYNRLSDRVSKIIFEKLVSYHLFPSASFKAITVYDDNEELSNIDIIQGDVAKYIIENKNPLKNSNEKYAFCLAGGLSDLWEIPILIGELLPERRLLLRNVDHNDNKEAVLYVIPKRKKKNPLRTAASVMPMPNFWSNVDITKDCGAIPYLLYKEHKMDVSMVGFPKNMEGYTNAKLVEGMKLVTFDKYDIEVMYNYISENAKKIDLLILQCGYINTARMARFYNSLNPEGIIYCALDANSQWMDTINWYQEDYKWFIDNCDIMATSCTSMADHLTEKWHRKIDVITNGYYDFSNDNLSDCKYEEKENIIFTAARLGIPQKRTDILLKAFALVADELPGWSLRLAGAIEESFTPFIKKFFEEYPMLKDRITFLGMISDRQKLAQEFKKAKIFALPSMLEGGSPNVIGEALYSGCAIAVSDIDAYEDCTGKGKCGCVSKKGDVLGFAGILKQLATDPELEQKSEWAKKYAGEMFDMSKTVSRLYNNLLQLNDMSDQ